MPFDYVDPSHLFSVTQAIVAVTVPHAPSKRSTHVVRGNDVGRLDDDSV